MGFVVDVCPHCSLAEAQMMVRGFFTPEREHQTTDHFVGSVMTTCPRCQLPVAWVLDVKGFNPPRKASGLLTSANWHEGRKHFERLFSEALEPKTLGLRIVESWPGPPEPDIPDHVPQSVEKPLRSAERNYPIHGNEEAAGAMYGRALEVAIKDRFPDLNGSLYARIEALAANHTITVDLKDWAHNIRDLRNGALHEVADLERDQLTALRLFTLALMQYLYTMPEHVRIAREETETLASEDASKAPATA